MGNKRLVDIDTPLGAAVWFRQMTGTEALSVPFEFDVVLHSDSKSLSLSANAILGQGVTLKVETETGGVRPIHGICTRFASAGREGDHLVYTAKLRPWLWIASRRTNCKIFQLKTVPEIITEVLGEYPYLLTKKLTKTYRAWDYCVQYQESDMNFVMRLMEHEGIYFYFEHAVGSHTMVMADDMSCHTPLPGKSLIEYVGADAATTNMEEHIDSWLVRGEVDSGKFFTDDYDFQNPKADLKVVSNSPMPHTHAEHEHYEWPGGYVKHADGENYAKIGLEMLEAEHERCQGNTNVRTMAPGYTFTLKRCPRADQNRQYLAVATTYFFRDNAQLSTGSGEGDADWGIVVTAQPTTMPYRPQLLTPKPRTHGPQTALVVGPAGEEIHTDEYGRIRVQFHWDRVGQKNQKSSCWLRVASPWAAGKWGMIQIPRIGNEVLVDFLGGDPDYPIVTGSVYNRDQPVPYELPKYAATSTWKSHSTPGGSTDDYNEIRFDDRKGKEQIFVRAQKRMDVRVKENKFETVQGSSQTSVGGEHALTVGNAFDLHVKDTIYERADKKLELSTGSDMLVDVAGEAKLHVTGALLQNALSVLIEGKTSVTLKCGGSYIKIGPDGVTIQGPMVRINCGGGTPGATGFDVTDPVDAGGADTGQPGYLDNLPHGGGGGGRRTRHVGPERAREITKNADGSVTYGGNGIRISGSPAFVDKTIATLDSLDGTQTGHQLVNNLQSNGRTASIVEDDAKSNAGGGGLTTSTTANGFPAGTQVSMPDGTTQTSDGSGSDSTVNWKPGYNAPYTDAAGNTHTQPDEALLGHELNHSDHNGRAANRAATPDPKDATGNQEESTTIGINDHADEPVSENNILRDMGENWRRTDHDSTARAVP